MDADEIASQLPHDFSGYPSTTLNTLVGPGCHQTIRNTATRRRPDETIID